MANYNLVIDTQFQPFSYQEMLHPVQEATKAHQQIEEAYSTISLEAAQWEKLANEAGSETAYQTYKDYANNLREQADMLAREGLTPMSRQNLSKARTAYIEKIDPIKQAYDRRMQIRDLQEKGRMQDGDIMYEMEAGDIGLDNLIANPNYTPRAYSGKQIYQDTAQMASNLTKRILDDPDQDKWKSILGGQYYELKYGRGLSPAQVLATLQGSPEGSAELYTIMNDVISATGIQNWDNQAALEKAWDYARKGAWSAIGQDGIKQLSNKAYGSAMAASGGGSGRRTTKPASNFKYPTRNFYDISSNYKNLRQVKTNVNLNIARYNKMKDIPFNRLISESEYFLKKEKQRNKISGPNQAQIENPKVINPEKIQDEEARDSLLTEQELIFIKENNIQSLDELNLANIQRIETLNRQAQMYNLPYLDLVNPNVPLQNAFNWVKDNNKGTIYTYSNDGKSINKPIDIEDIEGITKKEDGTFEFNGKNVHIFMPPTFLQNREDKMGISIGNTDYFFPVEAYGSDFLNNWRNTLSTVESAEEYFKTHDIFVDERGIEYDQNSYMNEILNGLMDGVYYSMTRYRKSPGVTGND